MLVLLACVAQPAYAYVDPGTGLLAIQVGGSMLAAALLVLRSKVRKLLGIAPRGVEDPETQNEGSLRVIETWRRSLNEPVGGQARGHGAAT